MAIDLDKLKKASEGDPKAKVTVNKAWLAEVHRALTELPKPSKADKRLDDVFKQMFGKRA